MSEPKSLMLDMQSWKRSLNPAVRVFGYTAAIYFIMYVTILLPIWLLQMGETVFNTAGAIIAFATIFAFVTAIFKVTDEEKAKENPLKLL